jgi:DNA-binding NtrC family response regulator
MARILVIDEDELLRDIITNALKKAGHEVEKSASQDEAVELIKASTYHIAIASRPDSVNMLKSLKSMLPDAEIIIMTDHSITEEAAEAMKSGAWSYLVKPISLEQLKLTINRALEKRQLAATMKHLQEQAIEKYRLENIVAANEKMLRALELAEKASRDNSPVLIIGESGTGKHLIGKTIHTTSLRRREPFIYMDLNAVDEKNMESVLFGSVNGTARNVRGRIEKADRGTVFLSEITMARNVIQEKLLDLLEYNMLYRAGSEDVIYVDARLIATSASDTQESMLNSHLFQRLSEVRIHLPPLRERKDEIPLLTDHFMHKYSKQLGKDTQDISEDALQLLMEYDWPGNVRELGNTIRRAVAFANDGAISASHLPQVSNPIAVT